jgi:prepilin-type N-terminal cleavage/methylation domain-containing protein
MTGQERDDEGLTLIELLVAMAITLIIITPLFSSFVLTLGQSARSEQDITNSADAQTLSAYFPQDVANADSVRVTSACGGSSSILELQWDDGAGHWVSYQSSTTTLQGLTAHQVTRYECTTAGGSPVRSDVVVRSAASVPAVSCDGVPCTNSTVTPKVITFAVDDLGSTSSELHYAFTLTGTRRVTT